MLLTRDFVVRNPDHGLVSVLHGLRNDHREVESRNGKAYAFNGPTTIVYKDPTQAVLFNPFRDANPFFHVMEFLWMLAGRNDVSFVSHFAANMKKYSVDGHIFHAAYGNRMKNHFSLDQLEYVINKLSNSPDSRQVVVSLWDADVDLVDTDANALDRPCNLMMKFSVRPLSDNPAPHVHLTVFNRSNDIVFGTFGANLVHMSMFLMYVADRLGLPVGYYNQVSDDLHLYGPQVYGDRLWKMASHIAFDTPTDEPQYAVETAYYEAYPRNRSSLFAGDAQDTLQVVSDLTDSLNDVYQLSKSGLLLRPQLETIFDAYQYIPFIQDFIRPMVTAHFTFKTKINSIGEDLSLDHRKELSCNVFRSARGESNSQRYLDWFRAGEQWIQRRGA